MASDWRRVTLGEVARIKHGFAFKGEHFTDEVQPHVLVTPGNFAVGGGFQRGKAKFYAGPVPSDYVLAEGDLIVTMTDLSKASDTLGYAARVPATPGTTYLHNQRVGLVQVFDEQLASSNWLHYLMRTDLYRSWVIGSASGTTVKHTSPSRIQSYSFPLPPIEYQKSVARLLDVIEDRVDNLRQTNATLEAIAQALFKSWFVDFDPVRAKAEGREPEGMDAATAALFPSEFEDSELGPIPKGWRVETFGSAFEFTMGQSPPGTTYNTDGEGAAFFQGCTDFGDVFPVRRVFTTAPSRFAKAGDVLMSVRAPVGAVNLAVTDCAIGRGLCAIRHKSGSTGLTIEFVKASVQRIEAAAGEGALFKSLSKRQLADLPVVSAGEALVTAAIELLDPIVERRLLLARQAESLTQLRDTLLPRLISGRLRLSTIHSDSTSVGHNPTANNEDSDIKA